MQANPIPYVLIGLGLLLTAVLIGVLLRNRELLAVLGLHSLPELDESDLKNYHQGDARELFWACDDPLSEYRERITAVALKHPNGTVYWADAPLRHHNIINNFMTRIGMGGSVNTSPRFQGFITSHGRFVDRREALAIAEGAKQIVRKTDPINKLYSEDLWI